MEINFEILEIESDQFLMWILFLNLCLLNNL